MIFRIFLDGTYFYNYSVLNYILLHTPSLIHNLEHIRWKSFYIPPPFLDNFPKHFKSYIPTVPYQEIKQINRITLTYDWLFATRDVINSTDIKIILITSLYLSNILLFSSNYPFIIHSSPVENNSFLHWFFPSLTALRRASYDDDNFDDEDKRVHECEHSPRDEHVHVLLARVEFVVVVIRAEDLPPIIDNYASSNDVEQRAHRAEQYQRSLRYSIAKAMGNDEKRVDYHETSDADVNNRSIVELEPRSN